MPVPRARPRRGRHPTRFPRPPSRRSSASSPCLHAPPAPSTAATARITRFVTVDASALLMGLSDEQTEAVLSPAAPLCILAGPGSGKTKVLTRRIAWRIATDEIQASHVLALTFTRKAAMELRSRLASLGVRDRPTVGTFHAVAYASLRRRWADSGIIGPTLVDDPVRILTKVLGEDRRHGNLPRLAQEVAAEISWAKTRGIKPANYCEHSRARSTTIPSDQVASYFAGYEQHKKRRKLIDVDDLVSLCSGAIEADRAFGAAQRWRYRHLFVDEVQDLNPAQWRLLDAWRGTSSDLCVVGDMDQAIYAWNGAAPELLSTFAETLPSDSVITLRDNWRCTPQIAELAEVVLHRGGTTPPSFAVPRRAEGPAPLLAAYEDPDQEVAEIARAIRTAHLSGRRYRDIAILARTNAQLAPLAAGLKSAGIPCGQHALSTLARRPEVRGLLGQLSASKPGGRFTSWCDEWEELVTQDPDAIPPEDAATLAQAAREHAEADPWATPESFAKSLSSPSDHPRKRADAVQLLSFHRSKGLQWPMVFLVGLEDGVCPLRGSGGRQALEEERRLLYVAITRAQDELHCSWVKRRGPRSPLRSRSPFLEGIDEIVARSTALAPLPDALDYIASARALLGQVSE